MSEAHVDLHRVRRFALLLPQLGEVQAFDFCTGGEGTLYPPREAEGVLEFFFFACTHQYGFWHLDGDRYAGPMLATIDEVRAKGSDFLTRCLMRAWRQDPAFFAPANLARLTDADCEALFQDDEGFNPLPQWPTHLALIRRYADWFLSRHESPAHLLARAQGEAQPLAAFLRLAGEVPGYAEDPLQKKLMLLAIILENRPEHFLRVSDPQSAVPIIDYHLQRSALRTGLVVVDNPTLAARLEQRQLVTAAQEDAVRRATYEAITLLVEYSGLSVAAIDWFFFTNRTRCPEMTEPRCATCPVRAVCARRKQLFQPIFLTTAY